VLGGKKVTKAGSAGMSERDAALPVALREGADGKSTNINQTCFYPFLENFRG